MRSGEAPGCSQLLGENAQGSNAVEHCCRLGAQLPTHTFLRVTEV